MICKYFLPFHELSFCFAYGVLWCTNVLNFDEVQCTFLACGFGVITKKPLPNPRWWKLVPMFSSKTFIWALTFRLFKIYFELTFVCRHSVVPVSFVRKDYTFPKELSWYSCLKKKIDYKCKGLFLDSQFCDIFLSPFNQTL